MATAPRRAIGGCLGPVDHGAKVKCILAVGHIDRASVTGDRRSAATTQIHSKDAIVGPARAVENCDSGEGVGVGNDEGVGHDGCSFEAVKFLSLTYII